MNSENPEFEGEFQLRLDSWIARQSLWFQIRHASSGKNVIKCCFGLLFRLIGLLFILSIGFWFYLTKQVGNNAYTDRLKTEIMVGLNASKIDLDGVRRVNSKFWNAELSIKSLELNEGDESFYEDVILEGDEKESMIVKGITLNPLGVTDGIFTDWSGTELFIQSLKAQLKAGEESNELAEASYKSLFKKHESIDIRLLKIGKVDLNWGYSKKTKGSINGASLEGELGDDGWSFVLRGGEFSYGFIRGAKIKEIKVNCAEEGLSIEKALLSIGGGEVEFTAKRSVEKNPQIDGEISFSGLPLDQVLQGEFQSWLSGTVSGKGRVFGRLGSQKGLDYDLRLDVKEREEVVVADQFPFMRSMKLIDSMNSYRRFRFNSGGFQFKTEGEKFMLGGILLKVDSFLTLSGNITVEAKEREEVFEVEDVTNEEGEIKEVKKIISLAGSYPYFVGDLKFGLTQGVFDRSEELQELFKVDKAESFYEVDVNVDSYFEGVTQDVSMQLDEVYQRGRK